MALQPGEMLSHYNLIDVAISVIGAISTAEALDCLESAVESGLTQRGWLEHDSNLDLVRGDPRFQALLKRLE